MQPIRCAYNNAGSWNVLIYHCSHLQSFPFECNEFVLLQLRESIAQDQEKTESLTAQIQELERNIQLVENKILNTESTLEDLRKLQSQISTNTTARSTLFKLQQAQYAALAEENEGQ